MEKIVEAVGRLKVSKLVEVTKRLRERLGEPPDAAGVAVSGGPLPVLRGGAALALLLLAGCRPQLHDTKAIARCLKERYPRGSWKIETGEECKRFVPGAPMGCSMEQRVWIEGSGLIEGPMIAMVCPELARAAR